MRRIARSRSRPLPGLYLKDLNLEGFCLHSFGIMAVYGHQEIGIMRV